MELVPFWFVHVIMNISTKEKVRRWFSIGTKNIAGFPSEPKWASYCRSRCASCSALCWRCTLDYSVSTQNWWKCELVWRILNGPVQAPELIWCKKTKQNTQSGAVASEVSAAALEAVTWQKPGHGTGQVVRFKPTEPSATVQMLPAGFIIPHMNPNTVESADSDHVCQDQIDLYKQMKVASPSLAAMTVPYCLSRLHMVA